MLGEAKPVKLSAIETNRLASNLGYTRGTEHGTHVRLPDRESEFRVGRSPKMRGRLDRSSHAKVRSRSSTTIHDTGVAQLLRVCSHLLLVLLLLLVVVLLLLLLVLLVWMHWCLDVGDHWDTRHRHRAGVGKLLGDRLRQGRSRNHRRRMQHRRLHRR